MPYDCMAYFIFHKTIKAFVDICTIYNVDICYPKFVELFCEFLKKTFF